MLAFSLPTPAQLLKLRRAGVEAWAYSKGDETLTLPLRPLSAGRGQRRVKAGQCAHARPNSRKPSRCARAACRAAVDSCRRRPA